MRSVRPSGGGAKDPRRGVAVDHTPRDRVLDGRRKARVPWRATVDFRLGLTVADGLGTRYAPVPDVPIAGVPSQAVGAMGGDALRLDTVVAPAVMAVGCARLEAGRRAAEANP